MSQYIFAKYLAFHGQYCGEKYMTLDYKEFLTYYGRKARSNSSTHSLRDTEAETRTDCLNDKQEIRLGKINRIKGREHQ